MQLARPGILLVCCLMITCVICWPSILQTGPKCSRSVDVAIIGAGPAGSYFAYRLRDAGLRIELFEYSDRIGGRQFTTTFPNIPDVNLELGSSRFVDKIHVRLQSLVNELNLTVRDLSEGLGRYARKKYFLRGQSLTPDEVSHGAVPYNLSPEEKANQGRLAEYYIEKLTGFSGTLTEELAFKLQALDGRELYKITLKEALAMVATAEGRRFLKDTASLSDIAFDSDTSMADYFLDELYKFPPDAKVQTLKEGMSSIPLSLVNYFLKSSPRNTLTVNRKLEAITRKIRNDYILRLRKTTTVDGLTQEEGRSEFVCAKRVVLAIPQFALTQLRWRPLSSPKIKKALSAVIPAKASKLYLAFPNSWWLTCEQKCAYSITTDGLFRQMYDWKSSHLTGDHIHLASYADDTFTEYQQRLNSKGELAPGSVAGPNRVTNRLQKKLLYVYGRVLGINTKLLPKSTGAISQFWTSYPFGGGWTRWRAGYNFTDVLLTIQRPSSRDEVYIVGSDISFIGRTSFIESALRTVDLVYDKYFKNAREPDIRVYHHQQIDVIGK